MPEKELSLLDVLSRQAREGLRLGKGMQLLRLGVENIFCYRQAWLDLQEGITVIAGPNGSGKSSLLESIFFALYGSRAGPAMGRSLGEVLREGAREGRARLDFICEGRQFGVEMGLRRQGDRVISERESCRLSRDDGAEWVGVEEVTAQVQGLLHMDRDDFTHSVYVRQGEIDRLIRAGDEERRGMIDRLLRLERLDSYGARVKEGARRAVNRRLATLEGQAAGLQQEIAALEAEELHREKARLQREINQQQEELDALEGERTGLEEARAELRSRLQRLKDAEKEAREGKKEWEEKKLRLKGREEESERQRLFLEGLQTKEREQQARLADLLEELELPREETFTSLKRAKDVAELAVLAQAQEKTEERLEGLKSEAQRCREGLARLEAELGHLGKQAENLDAQASELRGELAGERERLAGEREEIERLRSEIEGLNSQTEALRAQIDCPDLERSGLEACQRAQAARLEELRRQGERLHGELVAARTKRERVTEQLTKTEELIRAGHCPTCGQPLTAKTLSPTTEKLEEERRGLDGSVEQLQRDLENLGTERSAAQEEGEVLERLALLTAELRSSKDRLKERNQGLAQVEKRSKEMEERLRQAENALKANESELAAKRENQRELRQELAKLGEEQRRVQGRQALLEKAQELSADLIKTRTQLEEAGKRRKDLLQAIGELREDLSRLERRLRQLVGELGERARLEGEETHLGRRMAELGERRGKLQHEYGKLLDRRGVVASKLERLRGLEEERQAVALELEGAKRVGEEVEQLGGFYRGMKGELRRRNIAAINHYFNHLFHLMDSGRSYNRVVTGEGYEIEVELKDGRRIHPAIMSGGERALINIALRCAIHQVLAQAVQAMPLILDEPTIYLDRDRINRLQFLLEELGGRLGQVIVVSHEEGLVEGADHEYRTDKGRDNISTVERVR